MKIKKTLASLAIVTAALLPTSGLLTATAHADTRAAAPQPERNISRFHQAPSDPNEDPNLNQTVDANEANASGKYELTKGHVDMGPRMIDGAWKFMVRDDSVAPPVWRNPNEVVLRVSDKALLEIPDDPAYSFLNLTPGKKVYVIPQTQNMDVIWLGWNTQDPAVTSVINRGAKFVLDSVSGPGQFNVFLQSGSFDPPQELYNSTKPMPQEIWADVNTHVHANWVFTEPGVYTARISAVAETVDGKELKDTATLRFAVGDQTKTADAFAAQDETPASPQVTSTPAASETAATGAPTGDAGTGSGETAESSSISGTTWAVIGVALAVVVISIAAAIGVARSRSARHQAERIVQAEADTDSTDRGEVAND